MEHTDFKQPDNPLLQCAASNKNTRSSWVAADKATHTLTEDLRTVLGVLERYNGSTAAELGKQLVMDDYIGDTVSVSNIDDIKRLINLPDKKMSKLVALGYVRVEEKPGGNLNYITDAGRKALK